MDASLSRAKSAVERFATALGSADGFEESLAIEYNRVRIALATNFQKMSLDALPHDRFHLGELRLQIEATMRQLFSGQVESDLFLIHGYSSPHPNLYAYLASRVGEAVPAWRLRLLTRDATHTERRTRELRDFGLLVDAVELQGEAHYLLRGLHPDLSYGAAFQLRRNAIESKRISQNARAIAIRLAEATAPLPEKKSAA